MSDAVLTLRQLKYTNRAFWRNPASAFFTFAFPLMFLVIFTAIFSGKTDTSFGRVNISTYYIPAIATFSIITATYTNLAVSVTFLREAGTLKRVRGTPMPAVSYLTARIIHAILMAILLVVIVTAFGVAFYHAHITARPLPAFIVTIVVATALSIGSTVVNWRMNVTDQFAAKSLGYYLAAVNATLVSIGLLIFIVGVFKGL